ncbi:MAG: AMP-binding protein [Actinomycetota bacterium]|nr:AMP-binding protein [Actinomycetota bacterium]
MAGLLDWLDDPRAGHGVRFADDEGGWAMWEYPRLASLVTGAAEQVAALRHAREGAVSLVLRSGPEFFAGFVGALAAGNTPSPLALPTFMRDRAQYVEHAASILRTAQPVLVLVDEGSEAIVEDAAEAAGLPGRVARIEFCERPPAASPVAARAELALLQFTSGSSGRPRAVRVTWGNLEANVAMIRRWLEMRPDDATATWLPLYHDMGLIGCMITPMVNQSDVWVMRPEQFIRDPVRWLECYGVHGAQLGVAPNFGFGYANKRLDDEALQRMDFSEWRVAIVGAERLDADVLGRFARRLEPRGFRASAFLPAYGLAEATLAVTGVPLGDVPNAVRPDWRGARFGEPLSADEATLLTDAERIGSGDGWLVGCGRPHPRVGVAIVGEDGGELPEGHLGEIAVTGPTVAGGYLGEPGASTRFEDDRLLTGDAGFLLGGELYVMGRLGDSVKVRGRTVFVEDMEARTAAFGVPKGKCAVLAGTHAGANVLAALVELPPGGWVEEVAAMLEREGDEATRIAVISAEPGSIERTSSGKPRRRVMWQRLVAGELPGQVVHAGATATA